MDDPTTLVFVLIDEVESLTSARSSAMSGSEPSDAIRVVNAMLTQLDRLKRNPNVLTLCTTNLASSVDAAFIDRADIKAFIGLPPLSGRYAIIRDCVLELMRVGLVVPSERVAEVPVGEVSEQTEVERILVSTAAAAEGLSGRTLRKLPFLAHATYVQDAYCSPQMFAAALQNSVTDELAARAALASNGETVAGGAL